MTKSRDSSCPTVAPVSPRASVIDGTRAPSRDVRWIIPPPSVEASSTTAGIARRLPWGVNQACCVTCVFGCGFAALTINTVDAERQLAGQARTLGIPRV